MSSRERRGSRYRGLDVWRGLICLFVVLEHASVSTWDGLYDPGVDQSCFWRGFASIFQGNLGTPLFFVISGYCIAASVDSMRSGPESALSFLTRRFWRVFPAYWTAMLCFVLMILALDHLGLQHWHQGKYSLEILSIDRLDLSQWLGNATLTETWRPRLLGRPEVVFTRVAWSLCYQEQFYLVCFFVLLLTRRGIFKGFVIVTLVALSFQAVASDIGFKKMFEGTFLIYWHLFAIGVGVYWRLNQAVRPSSRHIFDLTLLTISLIAFRDHQETTAISASFGLGLVWLHRWDELLDRWKFLGPFRRLGVRSYSIYLVHLMAITLVTGLLSELGLTQLWQRALIMVPLSLGAGVGLGLVFHHWIEAPILQFAKDRDAQSPIPALPHPPRPTRFFDHRAA